MAGEKGGGHADSPNSPGEKGGPRPAALSRQRRPPSLAAHEHRTQQRCWRTIARVYTRRNASTAQKRCRVRHASWMTNSSRSSPTCLRSYRQGGTDSLTCITYTETLDRRGVWCQRVLEHSARGCRPNRRGHTEHTTHNPDNLINYPTKPN